LLLALGLVLCARDTAVAAKLLMRTGGNAESSGVVAFVSPTGLMNKDFQLRFTAGLLFLVTVAACAFSWINFQKDQEFQIPYDGVWWLESRGHLVADKVEPHGPGDNGGIREGDVLTAVSGREVKNTPTLERQLFGVGVWQKATYSVVRRSVPLDVMSCLLRQTVPSTTGCG